MKHFLRRIKNLWQLSDFVITKFDNQLVITRKGTEDDYYAKGLYVAKENEVQKKAQIIQMKPPVKQFLENNPIPNE